MWEQLCAANPPLLYLKDIEFFVKYRDCRKFMQFMMGLHEDFEPTKASLLSWSLTPSLDVVVKDLISKENHQPTYHMYLIMCWLHHLLLHNLPLLHSLLLHE